MPFEGRTGNDWVTGYTNFFLSTDYKIPNVTDVARRTVGDISADATNFKATSFLTSVTKVDNTERIDALQKEIDNMLKISREKPNAVTAENIKTYNYNVAELNRLKKEQGQQIISTPQYVGGETTEEETTEGGMAGF